MQINKLLTPYNHNSGSIDRIKYIVIHYVGARGGARANCQWYAGWNRGASAHYFVDFDGSTWQSVEDKDIAWHCGAKSYRHPECRNANSIGIEMCVHNKGSQADTSHGWHWFDGAICTGHVTVDGKWYIMDNAGRMIVDPVVLTPGDDGALRCPGLAEQ